MIFALFYFGLNKWFKGICVINYINFYTNFYRRKNKCNKFITSAKVLVKTSAKSYVKLFINLKIVNNTNMNICFKKRYVMDFIKPKNTNKENISWKISRRTKLIVEYYAKYTEYEEDEVVDMFLQNILKDKDFVEWLGTRRSKKKIDEIIFSKDNKEVANTESIENEVDF